jgi:predicted CopG family antitoxin
MYIMGFVNIIIHEETREKLNKIKILSRESYNDVITRLIDEHEKFNRGEIK